MRTYVVKRGDNLTTIARRFGTSIARIMRANLMQKKVIYPRTGIAHSQQDLK